MPTLTEGRHTGEFLVSEANGYRSRDVATLANAAVTEVTFAAGLVLARRDVGAGVAAAKSGGNTGNGTISAITILAGAVAGIYTVRFTAATAFTVEKPDGDVIGSGATGVAFADDVGFTITAGGTPFVAGDGFDITVAAGDGLYIPFTNATNLPAIAVLYDNIVVAASSTKKATIVARDAEVNAAELQYDASLSGGGLTAAKAAAAITLRALGIVPR